MMNRMAQVGSVWLQVISLCVAFFLAQSQQASGATPSELEDLWVSLMSRCIAYVAGDGISLQDAETFEEKPEADDQRVQQSATFEQGIRLRYGRSDIRPTFFSRNCGFSLPNGTEEQTLTAMHDVAMAYYDTLEENAWTRGVPSAEGAPVLLKGIWIEVAEKCKILAGTTIEWVDGRVGFTALLNGSKCAAPLADR